MDTISLIHSFLRRHARELALLSAGMVLVLSTSNTLTMLDLLELLCIAIGLLLAPWAFRTHYRDALQSPVWLLAALGLALLVALPHLALVEYNIRNVVSTLLLAFYAIPLVRTRGPLRWLWYALLSILISFELLPLAIASMEGGAPTSAAFQALFLTNAAEAREYLGTHVRAATIVPFAAGALLLPCLCWKAITGHASKRVVTGVLSLAFVSLATGIAHGAWANYQAFHKEAATWEKLATAREQGLEKVAYTAAAPARSRKVLLVVGESTTRRHMSLYGYPASTTPRLEAMRDAGELFAFDQVVSPHCLTMPSLEKVLTNSNNETRLPFADSVGLLDVFRKAGFRTWWVSNQGRLGLWDNQVSVLARGADAVHFTNIRIGKRFDASPDEVLFPLVDRLLPKGPGKVLFVCHLMGAHFDYAMRVPEEQRLKGTEGSIGPKAYDQAIRYGDAVLAGLIRKAEAAGFDQVVYLSDHGECPHHGRGHSETSFDPEMCEIPFLVWLSKETRERDPDLVRRLRTGLHRPFMTDGFFHTMLDLAGVDCSLMDPTRSVVNPRFQARPRAVLNGRIPYVPGGPELHDQG